MTENRVSGRHFIVAAVPEPNEPDIFRCAFENKTHQIWSSRNQSQNCPSPGISIEYFYLLASFLNFTYEIRVPSEGTYGKKLDDGQWNGALGLLVRGEADISFNPFFMTNQRWEVLNFGPFSLDMPVYGFLFNNPSKGTSLFSVFYPLNWRIYAVVGGAYVLVFSLSLFLALLKGEDSYLISLQISWIMLDMNARDLKKLSSYKVGLIIFSWFLSSYTLSNAYKSNLIVSAVYERNGISLRNLTDATRFLTSGRLNLVVPKENLAEFRNVLDVLPAISVEYEDWARVLQNYTPHVASNASDMETFLSDPSFAYFGDIRSVTWLFAKQPSPVSKNFALTFVKTAQGAGTTAFAFRRDFPYAREFRTALAEITTKTVNERINKKYQPASFQNFGTIAEFEEKDASFDFWKPRFNQNRMDALEFGQLMNLFVLWYFGCSLATMVFLLELYFAQLRLIKR